MKVVIACAGSKRKNAGRMRTADGKPVEFVAQLNEVANRETDVIYARPDDVSDDGSTWRERLVVYNQTRACGEPTGLSPAYKLYGPRKPYSNVYKRLVEVFGIENVYILSAGWGLVNASFLLPKYDITFNSRAYSSNRRRKNDPFCDFNHLENGCTDDLLFFGGVDYRLQFITLTEGYVGRRVVYFNSADIPVGNRVHPVRFRTRTKTNWHYECANLVASRYESDRVGFEPERSMAS